MFFFSESARNILHISPSQPIDNSSEMTKLRTLQTIDMIMVLRAGLCKVDWFWSDASEEQQ